MIINSDIILASIIFVWLCGMFLYLEIINRKQKKQIEEWRKEWF